jgi:transcriptional antiterminator RfaH
MALQWYALRSKTYKESVVWQQLVAQDIQVFYPRLHVRPVNPRARTVKPYFPGYLFIRVELDTVGFSAFQRMPHAIGLVCFGGVPAWVPDSLIDAIRRHLAEIQAAGGELLYRLRPGDTILIRRGPFAGYEGIFDTQLNGSERVRVLLNMLSDRLVPIELYAGQIQKK